LNSKFTLCSYSLNVNVGFVSKLTKVGASSGGECQTQGITAIAASFPEMANRPFASHLHHFAADRCTTQSRSRHEKAWRSKRM
jgi:hypothetical protein